MNTVSPGVNHLLTRHGPEYELNEPSRHDFILLSVFHENEFKRSGCAVVTDTEEESLHLPLFKWVMEPWLTGPKNDEDFFILVQ